MLHIISWNIGTCNLPDMYALSSGPIYGTGMYFRHAYQANHLCL